jgi:holo-[acyl-carrier protein] synthase
MIYGTGVDITEVGRLRRAVDRWGDSFLHRIFTEDELYAAAQRATMYYQHLAGRFAAKEAVFKAAGIPDLGFKDMEIINDRQGKPVCRILNGKGKKMDVLVSISHVKNYAVANALVTKEG